MLDETFEEFMTMLDLPAFVVTTQAAGQPAGCLVGFATQTGVAPPRFLVGLAKGSHTFGVASLSQHGVNKMGALPAFLARARPERSRRSGTRCCLDRKIHPPGIGWR